MLYFVTIGDRTFEVELTEGNPHIDGKPVDARLARVGATPVHHLLVDGRGHGISAVPGDRRGRWSIAVGAARLEAEAIDERTRVIREMTGTDADASVKSIVAPMPGLVVRVEVEPGQSVVAGQGVLVVEAMKMENELKAPADGVVAEIRVAAGETVEKGAVLLVLE